MEQLNLYLNDLKQTFSGVDGELCLTIGEEYFPSENWRELVSATLECWIPGFVSFAQGHTDVCLLQFMDGPYAMKMNRDASGAVRVFFLRDSREVRADTVIDFRELVYSVLKCLRTYDRTMHQWGRNPRWTKEQSVLNHILKQV